MSDHISATNVSKTLANWANDPFVLQPRSEQKAQLAAPSLPTISPSVPGSNGSSTGTTANCCFNVGTRSTAVNGKARRIKPKSVTKPKSIPSTNRNTNIGRLFGSNHEGQNTTLPVATLPASKDIIKKRRGKRRQKRLSNHADSTPPQKKGKRKHGKKLAGTDKGIGKRKSRSPQEQTANSGRKNRLRRNDAECNVDLENNQARPRQSSERRTTQTKKRRSREMVATDEVEVAPSGDRSSGIRKRQKANCEQTRVGPKPSQDGKTKPLQKKRRPKSRANHGAEVTASGRHRLTTTTEEVLNAEDRDNPEVPCSSNEHASHAREKKRRRNPDARHDSNVAPSRTGTKKRTRKDKAHGSRQRRTDETMSDIRAPSTKKRARDVPAGHDADCRSSEEKRQTIRANKVRTERSGRVRKRIANAGKHARKAQRLPDSFFVPKCASITDMDIVETCNQKETIATPMDTDDDIDDAVCHDGGLYATRCLSPDVVEYDYGEESTDVVMDEDVVMALVPLPSSSECDVIMVDVDCEEDRMQM